MSLITNKMLEIFGLAGFHFVPYTILNYTTCVNIYSCARAKIESDKKILIISSPQTSRFQLENFITLGQNKNTGTNLKSF